MNVYDFDGTIYDGDSTTDFLKYVYRKYPAILLPAAVSQTAAAALYLCKRISKEQMKERFFAFLAKMEDVGAAVSDFWDINEGKIKEWYLKQQREDDVVISASPDFLLKEICDRKKIASLIATRMDSHTGKITGKNCRGSEKPRRFSEEFPNAVIENFYSDHPSDAYMARMADKAWIVKGNEILPWKYMKQEIRG